ncbi:MAG: BON domain-containing protein [Pseudomonadota bacterium]
MSKHQVMTRALLACAMVGAAATISGCTAVGLGVGALATTGVSVAQERTTRQALTDAEIRITINNKLANESLGLFADITTEVVEGRVLLAGSVPTQDNRIRATQLVWETPDVVELINEITVESDAGVSSYAEDVWISTQLRAKLLGDVEVNSINYNIETVGQTVHLIGVARSEGELERVVAYASSIDGVKQVVSHVLTKHDDRRARG